MLSPLEGVEGIICGRDGFRDFRSARFDPAAMRGDDNGIGFAWTHAHPKIAIRHLLAVQLHEISVCVKHMLSMNLPMWNATTRGREERRCNFSELGQRQEVRAPPRSPLPYARGKKTQISRGLSTAPKTPLAPIPHRICRTSIVLPRQIRQFPRPHLPIKPKTRPAKIRAPRLSKTQKMKSSRALSCPACCFSVASARFSN